MPPSARKPRRFHPPVGVIGVLALLILVFALLEGAGPGPSCSGVLPPVSADESSPVALATLVPPTPLEKAPDIRPGPATPENARSVGNVDGRVVDARTGEAVPELHVTLSSGAVSETVVTDANGVFVSSETIATGQLRATLVDDEQLVGSAVIDHDAATGTHQWLIEAPIGPTYPIVTVNGLVPEPQAWRARLLETTLPPGSDGEIDVSPNTLTVVAPRSGFERRVWKWARVRPGVIPWVRFPRATFEASGDYYPRIELRSDAQFMIGDASVKGTVGLQHGVRFEAHPFGTVSGTISVTDATLNEDLRVLLLDRHARSRGRESFSSQPYWRVMSTGTSFSFDLVEPGAKVLFVLADRRRVARKDVYVSPGAESLSPITLEAPGMDMLRVDLLRAEGLRWGDGHQFLQARYDEFGRFVPAIVLDARAEIGKSSAGRALPLASALIELHGVNQPSLAVDWNERMRLDGGFVRVKTARMDTQTYTFAPDEASGARPFALSFGPSGSIIAETQDPSTFKIPRGSQNAFTAIAWSAGCKPTLLANESRRARKGGRNERVAEDESAPYSALVRMQPGWGALLVFRELDALQMDVKPGAGSSAMPPDALTAALACVPVPNVRVELNGIALGESDAEGELLLSYSAMPVRLTIQGGAFELARLQRLGEVGVRYIAWMRRKAVTDAPD